MSQKEGFMTKEGGRHKTWKKRWFVLFGSTLLYFKNPHEFHGNAPPRAVGTILLTNCTPQEETAYKKTKFPFSVEIPSRKYYFDAPSHEERLKWLEAVEEASKREDDYHTALEARVALIGPPKVGKTSLVRRWVNSLFTDAYQKTTKPTHMSKQLSLSEGVTMTLSVKDLGGEMCLGVVNGEANESITAGLEGMIFVFDLTDSDSWGSVKRMAYSLVQDMGKVAVFLVGTKRDLKDKTQVNSSVAEAFAEELGAAYFETSSKQSFQIDESFSVIVDLLYRTGRYHRSGLVTDVGAVEGHEAEDKDEEDRQEKEKEEEDDDDDEEEDDDDEGDERKVQEELENVREVGADGEEKGEEEAGKGEESTDQSIGSDDQRKRTEESESAETQDEGGE